MVSPVRYTVTMGACWIPRSVAKSMTSGMMGASVYSTPFFSRWRFVLTQFGQAGLVYTVTRILVFLSGCGKGGGLERGLFHRAEGALNVVLCLLEALLCWLLRLTAAVVVVET